MVTMGVLAEETLELTVDEFATLCLCLEVPQPVGLGARPFAGLSSEQLTGLTLSCLESLATKGYVDEPHQGTFRVRDVAAHVVTLAARAPAVLRVLNSVGDQTTGLLFVYATRELAVVHEIRPDGTHRLLPKPLSRAVDEVAQGVGGLSGEPAPIDDSLVLSRAELESGPGHRPNAPEDKGRLHQLQEDLARMTRSVRLDLAWLRGDATIAPYLVVIYSDEHTAWLLTGIGEEPDDLVTCHPARITHLRRALSAMLTGSAFELAQPDALG
jgi:hypothetical protein